jgi:hypothetical protein
MPVLRLVTPPARLRLVDNYARFNDPTKWTTLRIITPPARFSVGRAAGTVTLSGSVKNESNVGLANRSVTVYGDQGMTTRLGQGYTDASGNFSISVNGGTTQDFTVVVQGETGENTQVFSWVRKTV